MADPVLALADNVRRLMADRGDSQASVGKRAGISQRAVGDLMTYGTTHRKNPTIRTIGAISDAFDVPLWLLLIPEMPLDLLNNASRVAALIQAYRSVEADGRDVIERSAAQELKYIAKPFPLPLDKLAKA